VGEPEPVGDADGLAVGDAVGVGLVALGDGDIDGEMVGDGDVVGEVVGDGLLDGERDGVAAGVEDAGTEPWAGPTRLGG
jgi:hypothetical protein